MHLNKINIYPDKFPTRKYYPFNLNVFHETKNIELSSPVTFFVGENGTGKSTLLRATCKKSGVHIWGEYEDRRRFENNPYEGMLYRAIDIEWSDGRVPGSFFASETFQNFSQILDEWASETPDVLQYFGGKSLITQSHGESLMSFFKKRYQIEGIYFLDEPETALSPKSQLEMLKILTNMGEAGHAQFIIATHSPILMACPNAKIYNFDNIPVKHIEYENTEHYKIYKSFLKNKEEYLKAL